MRKLSILWLFTLACAGPIACNRSDTTGKPSESQIIFRDGEGRVLLLSDIQNVTGTFDFAVIGSENIPQEAQDLRAQARQAGGRGEYDKAIALLTRASELAPQWPYPPYDLAYTYLLMNDSDHARLCYEKTLALAPRGYFTAITALDTLQRERKGDLPAGTCLMYLSLDWMDNPAQRAAAVKGLVQRVPKFAPGWKELALLAENDADRLGAIEIGLARNPDVETKGMLLLNKALILGKRGDRDGAIQLLGQLALDPHATAANEHLAKATLATVVKGSAATTKR